MMLKVLLYGYVIGVRSSRELENACVERVAFRFLAANQTPDHRAFSRFRQRHLAAVDGLLVDLLGLCQTAGMVKLGNVGLDGTKVRANASRHKAMSYGRMVEREPDLAATVKQILDEAEAVDQAEDKALLDAGVDGYIATGRLKHNEEVPAAPRGSPPLRQVLQYQEALLDDVSVTGTRSRWLPTCRCSPASPDPEPR